MPAYSLSGTALLNIIVLRALFMGVMWRPTGRCRYVSGLKTWHSSHATGHKNCGSQDKPNTPFCHHCKVGGAHLDRNSRTVGFWAWTYAGMALSSR